MVAESDGPNYGGFGGAEEFLRRAGTISQRRHTRKFTVANNQSPPMPMPPTPTSIPTPNSSELDFDFPPRNSDKSISEYNNSPHTSSNAADQHSMSSMTSTMSASFDMDSFTPPDVPQPHLPLRKTSATNLRQRALRGDEYATAGAASPVHSVYSEEPASHTSSPRLRKDRQYTSSPRETASPIEDFPSRGRSRGMTTSSHRPPVDLDTRFRSPSIPDLRGSARANISSAYKPDRGPSSRDPSMIYGKPPPVPWKEGDEVRGSFRSGLTSATYTSSGFYEASETERSSVMTQSSSLSNYSQQKENGGEMDGDDYGLDVDDFLDMYADGFKDTPAVSGPSRASREYFDLRDPAIQEPLASSPPPSPKRPVEIERTPKPTVTEFDRPATQGTKYDSKFDDDVALRGTPSMPQLKGSPLLAHPINPALPSPPLASPPTLEDDYFGNRAFHSSAVSPISPDDATPFSHMEGTPLGTPQSGLAVAESFPPLNSPPEALQDPVPVPMVKRQDTMPVGRQAPDLKREPRDRYGFKKSNQYITAEQYDAWNVQYSEHLERRKTKWEVMMIQWGLAIQDPLRFPPRSDKVKRYVRKGIPPEWRGACWFWYAGGPARLAQSPGLYAELVTQAENGQLNEADSEIIERDLNRTFPDNIAFKPDQEPESMPDMPGRDVNPDAKPVELPIIQALRRVLQAFAIHNPSIGYCQSLNFLAGLLLLFLNDEEKSFHMLNIICNVHLPGTHARVLESNVDVGVLMTCIRDSMPQVWARIDDITAGKGAISTSRLPTVSLATTAWFMSCFIGNLPIESVLRVWDCFFYEGSKTLFRIALAIFKTGEMEIKNVNEHLEIFQVVQAIPRRMLDANALMESCYKRRNGFGHLSQDVIDSRRKERRTALQKERDKKNGQLSPRIIEGGVKGKEQEREGRKTERGRSNTLSRAASRIGNRAKSRTRYTAHAAEPMPGVPTMLGGKF